MASRALLLATTGSCSSEVNGRRWQARCSSVVRRDPLIRRKMKNVSSVCCAYVGARVVTENAKEVEAVSRGEEKNGWAHFVGIGGTGLSALALLALKQGYEVTGSDIVWSYHMDDLLKAGAKMYLGHSVAFMENKTDGRRPDAIIISSAIPEENVEVLHAELVGIPIYKRDAWLRHVTEQYNLIAIAGTHGKSTTTAMLSYVLHAMGDDLIAVIGADVPQLSEGNIISGNGPNFVLEADEYDCCFLGLSPSIAVVTNVEWEHVDFFRDEGSLLAQFLFIKMLCEINLPSSVHPLLKLHFLTQNSFPIRSMYETYFRSLCNKSGVEGISFCAGMGACSLLRDCKPRTLSSQDVFQGSLVSEAGYTVTTYGLSGKMDWHASCIKANAQGGQDYILNHKGCRIAEVSLKLPGNHNVLNSLAVIATIANLIKDGDAVHNTIKLVKYHLSKFEGISRRFEFVGKVNGCHFYDDYSHHPTEIRATLQAARQLFPYQRLCVVFQAHSYSRISALMKGFSTSFYDADYVIIAEVYSPREKNDGICYGKELATMIGGPASEYIPKLVDVLEKLVADISEHRNQETIIFAMGTNSEITTLGPKLLKRLEELS